MGSKWNWVIMLSIVSPKIRAIISARFSSGKTSLIRPSSCDGGTGSTVMVTLNSWKISFAPEIETVAVYVPMGRPSIGVTAKLARLLTSNEIEDVLNRMPIGNQSFGILKRKSELEMKIWEFNNAIDTFSHPKVYITV